MSTLRCLCGHNVIDCACARPASRTRLVDDPSAPAELRLAVELLRETPPGDDPALDAHWQAQGDRIASKVRASALNGDVR